MTRRSRVFVAIVLALALGIAALLYRLLQDIDPSYRESAEDSLVETAHLVASLVEQQLAADGSVRTEPLAALFDALYAREFEAKIFAVTKRRVDLRVVLTDAKGIVRYDSLYRATGEDHSQWREIARTLRGEYGARTSPDADTDASSAVMYVGAPVIHGGKIVGVVSAGRPVASFGQYVHGARRKMLAVGVASSAGVLLLMLVVSVWAVRPFGIVGDVLRRLRERRALSLAQLARGVRASLGAAWDDVRDALAGRNDTADYVQTLTHEVKSPLSAIRGAAELLQESMPDDDRRRFAANIARETGRIQELVDRMMELAAIESRRRLFESAPVPLEPLLEDVAASARASGAAREIGVVLRVAPHAAGAVVDGDAFLLRRAVANLVDNALDFAPDGSTVEIDLAATLRAFEVRVRDNGPGVPDYAALRVFDKFYSLARPHSGKRGTGLGLSFVKEIAELHRGAVTLVNAEGDGAVATLTLRR